MTTQHLKFTCGVACFVKVFDHVLLGRRAGTTFNGQWAMPGGHVQHGERPEDAARRELLEETGLLGIEAVTGPPILTYYKENGPHVSILVAFREVLGELRMNEEFDELRYFPIDDLPTPLFGPCELYLRMFSA